MPKRKPGTFAPGNPGGPGATPLDADKKRVKVWTSVLPAVHARILAARVGDERLGETVCRLILAGLKQG